MVMPCINAHINKLKKLNMKTMKIINAKHTQCYKVLELVNKHSFVRLNEYSGSL